MIDADPSPQRRAPQQGRSKASLERMLSAAEAVMAERGNDDFTLSDVAKRGKVSIGSIYCRFESKDDLIHAVQQRVLDQVDEQLLAAVSQARQSADGLRALIRALVESVSEALRRYADAMRPFMLRANSDPVVASVGKRSYASASAAVQAALLEYRFEIRHQDQAHAADAVFRIFYASLARYLGFGSSAEAAGEGNWTALKRDLTHMLTTFLTSDPEDTVPGNPGK